MEKIISTILCISLLISIICVPVSATSKNTEEANINDFINGVTYLAQTYDAGKDFEVTSENIPSESFSEDAPTYFSEASVSENETYYIFAKEKTEIDFNNKLIYTSYSGNLNLLKIVGVQETTSCFSVPSYVYRNLNYFGTGSIFNIYENGVVCESYIVIVEGDINGDSVVDVIDVSGTELATNNHKELTGNYHLAGDTNRDGVIDVVDYQSVVNFAL